MKSSDQKSSDKKRDNIFKRCPKTGKIRGINRKYSLYFFLFPVTGIIAILWFLIRVVPKPSRINYPCQKAALPLISAFIVWFTGFFGSLLIIKKAKKLFLNKRFLLSSGLFFVGVFLITLFLTGFTSSSLIARVFSLAAEQPGVSTGPVGTPKGINPGRVVWSHNPDAAYYSGAGYWWSDKANNQILYNQMMSNALVTLTGKTDEKDAWHALFRYINSRRYGAASRGYQKGDKIGIKINQNNTYSQNDTNEINGNPCTIFALVRSLVNAGVPEADLYIGDPSRYITNNIYSKIKSAYPGVHFVDNAGGKGRIKSKYVYNAITYGGSGQAATGIARMFTDSRYVINMALLKGHVRQGVTLCGKNFFGATDIYPDWRQNGHKGFGSGGWSALTDYMGHGDLGGKTVLWMVDAMYSTKQLYGTPDSKWNWGPFKGTWPASLFVSQDGVAVDSVALDFFTGQWGEPQGADWYLKESAQADNPPSGTGYKPDGTPLSSLGVHEHWDNRNSRRYFLIDLVYAGPGKAGREKSESYPGNPRIY